MLCEKRRGGIAGVATVGPVRVKVTGKVTVRYSQTEIRLIIDSMWMGKISRRAWGMETNTDGPLL